MRRKQFMYVHQISEYIYRKTPVYLKVFGIFLCIALVFPFFLTGCSTVTEKEEVIADYGEYGSDIARTLSKDYPYRKAYTPEEKAAGEYVKSEFEKLGYEVEAQSFSSADQTGSSTNYIVTIPGDGLVFQNASGAYITQRRQVIVGAHYDTFFGVSDAAAVPDFDGIQDNASGIGCLLTLAKELKSNHMGYDVILIAFGAGDAAFAGAGAYAAMMTEDKVSSTDAMYCIESIYAGDKLYASSGWNSLVAGQKYEMRRKLYEVYDVVYENSLSSQKGVDLLYNESGLVIDVNADGVGDVFREVTLTLSDYVPFDQKGIPVVFFESYDYNFASVAEMKETKNLNLQANGGLIRTTNSDSLKILEAALIDTTSEEEEQTEDQLVRRINSTAFIIYKAIEKGANNSISKAAYDAGATIAPTIHNTVSPAVSPAA